MPRNIFTTDAILDGYQAVFKPSKFGYSLSCLIDYETVDKLEEDRTETLNWAESKLKNKKRSTLKPEPWDEVSEGIYRVKFSWNEEMKPLALDCDLNEIDDIDIPIYSGSLVSIAFYQKPYILKNGVTYGTSLKLSAFQVVTLAKHCETPEDLKSLFKKRDGYVNHPE